MRLPVVLGRRAERKIEKTRWKPVDLVCVRPEDDGDGEGDEGGLGDDDASGAGELVVRTKLVRSAETAAVCLSEAVAFGVFEALGFEVAEPYAVIVSGDFAEDVTAQFDFEPPVVNGRHWGTKLITDAFEGEFVEDLIPDLVDSSETFLLYLADELLAYRDRTDTDGSAKHGNVLLMPARRGRLRILPIDQSDCFGHPSTICDPDGLQACCNHHFAHYLPGTEGVVLDAGPRLVDEAFARVEAAREDILATVEIPPDEWYGRAGTTPDEIAGFLTHRMDRLDVLCHRDRWRGVGTATEGGYLL